jgi:hypothetical protein
MSGGELDKLAAQLSPTPSVTVTTPVGVRTSLAGGVTLKLTVTGCPTTTELGEIEVIVVTVFALSTV